MEYVYEMTLSRPTTGSLLRIWDMDLPIEGLPADCADDWADAEFPGWIVTDIQTYIPQRDGKENA